jgi:hypothetical protein
MDCLLIQRTHPVSQNFARPASALAFGHTADLTAAIRMLEVPAAISSGVQLFS